MSALPEPAIGSPEPPAIGSPEAGSPEDGSPRREPPAIATARWMLTAVGWALATTALFFFLGGLAYTLFPKARTELALSFGCQVIAYGAGIAAVRLLHGRGAATLAFLAIRGAPARLLPVAIALGAAVQIPANAIYNLILRHFPSSSADTIADAYRDASPARRAVLLVIVVALGPLLEELFFRGALLGALRRGAKLHVAVVVTAILFALAHAEWQMYPPILLVGLILGYLRMASGSLLPSVLMHATFNLSPFLVLPPSRTSEAEAAGLPGWIVALGCAATIGLFFLARATSREEAVTP